MFAVLAVSVVLAVGLGLMGITYRQLVLSSTARESRLAHYIADAALDCANYWDQYRFGYDNEQRPFGYYEYFESGGQIMLELREQTIDEVSCFGQDNISVEGDSGNYFFEVDNPFNGRNACAVVAVTKGPGTEPQVVIRASGYNVSCSDRDSQLPRKIERTLTRGYTFGTN